MKSSAKLWTLVCTMWKCNWAFCRMYAKHMNDAFRKAVAAIEQISPHVTAVDVMVDLDLDYKIHMRDAELDDASET